LIFSLRVFFNVVLLAAIANTCFGQVTSPLGRFTVDFNRGCNPLSIKVTDNSGAPVVVFQYEGSGSVPDSSTTHIYNQTGSFWLVQTAQNFNPRQDSLLIEVFDPIPPAFEVFTCEGDGVSVQINDGNYDQYLVNFGDNTTVLVNSTNPVPTHFYSSGGTYTISVEGRFLNGVNNCGQQMTSIQSITTISPAQFNQLSVSNNNLILNFTLPQNIFYDLEIAVDNDTIFQKLKDLSNSAVSDTVKNLDLKNNYCFRITSFDPCNLNKISSEILCSVNAFLNIQNNLNHLSWSSIQGSVTRFDILRDSLVIANLGNLVTGFSDSAIICNTNYCYQVRAIYPGGEISNSVVICGTSFSKDIPSSIENISSIVTDNQIELRWPSPLSFTPQDFFISRAVSGNSPSPIDTVQVNNYFDPDLNTLITSYCYTINYRDQCGNQSAAGNESCSIVLRGSEDDLGFINLTWTSFTGWSNGVNNYRLEKFDQNGLIINTTDVGINLLFSDADDGSNGQVLVYRVTAIPMDTLESSVSNLVTIIAEPKLIFPSAFTPDGDSLNDVFIGIGKFINSYSLKIFDKWGSIIFISDDPDIGWDGVVGGVQSQTGTYVYRADFSDSAGRNFSRSGTVALLR